MPIYMNYDSLPVVSQLMSNGLTGNNILALCDGSVRVGSALQDISLSIKQNCPRGADIVIIGPASQGGWKLVANQKGIIAILIGLLLPAVQKVREAASRGSAGDVQGVLAPGGKAYVVGSNGKLLQYG